MIEGQPSDSVAQGVGLGYAPVPNWGLLPHGISFQGEVASVAVDADDRVLLFNRGTHPLVILDPDGNFLDSWDVRSEYVRPHAITLDGDGSVWLVDDMGHWIEKRSLDGEQLLVLGTRGKPAPWQGGEPFNRPTDLVVDPVTGDLYVTDGYGNSRIHVYSSEGELLDSLGVSGTGPGEFSLPHGVEMFDDDQLLVVDRENFRMQVLDKQGRAQAQWHVHHPLSVARTTVADDVFLVGELGPPPVQAGVRGLGSCVSFFDTTGRLVGRFGSDLPGQGVWQIMGPHGLAMDSRGDVYVGEVNGPFLKNGGELPDRGGIICIRKWRMVEDLWRERNAT